MNDNDGEVDGIIDELFDKVIKDGVAVTRVDNGVVYIFSREKLLELVAICDERKSDRCIVFIPNAEGAVQEYMTEDKPLKSIN
jgi:hypothetical protein